MADHQELCGALSIERAPDYITLYRCLRRLDENTFAQLLATILQEMPPSEQRLDSF